MGWGDPHRGPTLYFSAYEGQGYDPDDNNYLDADDLPRPTRNGVFGGFSTPNAPTATQSLQRLDSTGHRLQRGTEPLHRRGTDQP